MLRDLFINFCLLSTFLFFGDMALNILRNHFKASPIWLNLASGIGLGMFGIVQLIFTFKLQNGILLDFRQLSIIVAASVGGPWAALIASLIIATGRVLIFGGITSASIIGVVATLLTFVLVFPAFLLKGSFRLKWTVAAISTTIVALALLLYRLGLGGLPIIMLLAALQVISCVFTYYMVRYLRETREMHDMLKQEIEHDFLTGLYNSRGFESRYRLAIASGSPFALLLLDIDHFKKVNDTYGHPAGDAVLEQLGKIVREYVRKVGCASRKGGEEFAVILRPCDSKRAIETADRLRRKIEETPFLLPDGRLIHITISVGIGLYPTFSESQLVEETDRALYRAKQEGRNRGVLAV
ncbi:diguanylate cyclase [Saccharibacillus sp. JS10]|uniref:GGDEF domain-containing protein n=1 Tax=Saccharibacillus sp. JS10 TaxID=2950552 RepID=UPI00210B9125|nr:diguanylate cyclase [Saccharibacillus sp. JS10]MCQ4085312.1 diguanylate cyclase [Saccharibacillus sp. JS10]